VSGWIKLHRKSLDNPVVFKDADHIAIWTYLLLNATHKEYPAMFGGQKIMLQPGQLITGRKAISEKLRVQESKVERVLKLFESEHQIEQQKSNKNRIVTLVSWNEYQGSEQQDEQEMNNKRTTNEQQVNTNKNVKNLRSKEETSTTATTREAIHMFQNEIGVVNGMIVQKLQDDIETYGNEWVCDAIEESVIHNKRNYAYMRSILERWGKEGRGSKTDGRPKGPKQAAARYNQMDVIQQLYNKAKEEEDRAADRGY
jgi:DnaD and phage-associated domain